MTSDPSERQTANAPAALTYKDAGVDIEAGDALVRAIGPAVKATHRPEVLGRLGGFAGLCALPTKYKEPILVSGTDGVGTKLKAALATGRHQGIGTDLVAMCVNDILVTGAEPLFFLDYYATAALELEVAQEVISSIARACSESGCALLGGETAEMPGLYKKGDYDLAGFCVGVVERSQIRNGDNLREGDKLIGIASSGLHSNGHSLARKVLLEHLGLGYESCPEELGGRSIADELLEPTILYGKAFRALDEAGIPWKSAAHITGGGLVENPPRMLTEPKLDIVLDTSAWDEPAIFALISGAGVALAEMRRTFNMGVGMLVAVAPEHATSTVESIEKAGYAAFLAGHLAPGSGVVEFH